MYLIIDSLYDDKVIQKSAIDKSDLVESKRTDSLVIQIDGGSVKYFDPKANTWREAKQV